MLTSINHIPDKRTSVCTIIHPLPVGITHNSLYYQSLKKFYLDSKHKSKPIMTF
jgi:hypothetical protein